MSTYYLYRHIRHDKNVPFYIGIGKVEAGRKSFKRAFSSRGRNVIWKRIVAKTTFDIEILFRSDNVELIFEKEREFISLYKRYSEGGTLANITQGGEGSFGVKWTPAQYVNSRTYWKNNPHPSSKPLFAYRLDGKLERQFPNITSFHKFTGFSIKLIRRMLEQKYIGNNNWFLSYHPLDNALAIINSQLKFEIAARAERHQQTSLRTLQQFTIHANIAQYDLSNKLIKIWPDAHTIKKSLNYKDISDIYKVLHGKRKIAKGFRWELVHLSENR